MKHLLRTLYRCWTISLAIQASLSKTNSRSSWLIPERCNTSLGRRLMRTSSKSSEGSCKKFVIFREPFACFFCACFTRRRVFLEFLASKAVVSMSGSSSRRSPCALAYFFVVFRTPLWIMLYSCGTVSGEGFDLSGSDMIVGEMSAGASDVGSISWSSLRR